MNLHELITVALFMFPIIIVLYLLCREQPTVDVNPPEYGCGLAAMPDIPEEWRDDSNQESE
jgi:hypothetical protein